ncbi:MAG: NADH-quinone oxidoreductase subunit C [Armatimonadetes bacterium]|nr:NADH-quinone oxidoreductase subunit C [Armatimonadota bacterium]
MTPTTVSRADLAPQLKALIERGGRLALLTAADDGQSRLALAALVLSPDGQAAGQLRPALWRTPLDDDTLPPLTRLVPQAHWAKRALYDFFGLRPADQARPNPLLLHEAWPAHLHPLRPTPCDGAAETGEATRYRFLEVGGEGVYEIPVGPIHAGIIEPGHFRFSCHGEVIQHLEIRLGYQHRGLEEQLARTPWRQAHHVVSTISSDTAAGNALAHALAVESLLDIEPPPAAVALRAALLECERVACHLGDLIGYCADTGFAAGATAFSLLRPRAQILSEWLCGSRYQAHAIVPGGLARPLPGDQREGAEHCVTQLIDGFERAEPLLLDNSGALERMAGTGVVPRPIADEIGLVGPAGRAAGLDYDVRSALSQPPYADLGWQPARGGDGDVLARCTVRCAEIRASLTLLRRLLAQHNPDAPTRVDLPDRLPADRWACGLVEAWRGELVHLVLTGDQGQILRYAVKDPSFNNWTGLAVAARGEVVSDFPLCNKSFGLSYSGNDL